MSRLQVGCDVVDVDRLSDALQRRPGMLARVFTSREIADSQRGGVVAGSPAQRARLAARFAAKEAARKALGDLRLPFHDTEVRTDPDGAPRLWIRGEMSTMSLSLSHDGGVAMAVLVGGGDADVATQVARLIPTQPRDPAAQLEEMAETVSEASD